MILKLDQWLANAIGKEARIAHFNCKVYGGPASTIKAGIREQITNEYSEKFLGDADYVLFFKGESLNEDDALEKLSGIVKRALGKASANDLTVADFKLIKDTTAETPDDSEDSEQTEETAAPATESVKFAFVKITIK